MLVTEPGKKAGVSHNTADSQIEAFAQQAMVETFVKGYSLGVWQSVKEEFASRVIKISRDLSSILGAALPPDWMAKLEQEKNEFSDSWKDKVLEDHYLPLKNVITWSFGRRDV